MPKDPDDEVTAVIDRETMSELVYGTPALAIEDWAEQPTREIPPLELALLASECGARDTGSTSGCERPLTVSRTRTRDLK